MIAIGSLKRRICIRRWVDTPVGAFDVQPEFDQGVFVWAKVEVVGSQVYWATHNIGDSVTHRFYVRRVIGRVDERIITAQHIIEYGGYRYQIKRCNDYRAQGRYVVMEAKELGAIE